MGSSKNDALDDVADTCAKAIFGPFDTEHEAEYPARCAPGAQDYKNYATFSKLKKRQSRKDF